MEKKNTKKIAILAIAFIAVIAVIAALYFTLRPQGTEGAKTLTVEVVLADGTSTSHEVKTDAEFLGTALKDAKLIDGTESEYGLYITTVNGVVANDANQEWWCLTIDGEMSMYGVDEVPATDGGHYEFTLTVGW